MNGIDPYVLRDYAQDMGRALATAEATIDRYIEMQKAVRMIIADMKSNHDTHKNYIKRLEQTLDGEL